MAVTEPTHVSRWVLIGGDMGALVNVKDTKDYYEFEIKPTEWMRYNHQIEDRDLDPNTLTLKKKFQKKYCVAVDPSPKSAIWIVLCDWNGEEHDGIMNKINSSLLQEIEQSRSVIKQLRLNILRQREEATRNLAHPKESIKELLDTLEQMETLKRARDRREENEP